MFNGIVQNTGKIVSISKKGKNCTILVKSKMIFKKKEIGSSVSCSGVCLTIEEIKKNIIKFYLSKETLNKSIFSYAKIGDIINLEKSLKFGDRISGHFVQGHVDATSYVKKISFVGKSWLIHINFLKKYKNYVAEKGSITINGVSLTIAKVLKDSFVISVIPQTLKLTNLKYLKVNDFVNIEYDILAKYVKKFI